MCHSIGILMGEYIHYAFSKDYDNTMKNIADKLARINIFYVKIFQSLSTNSNILSNELIEYLTIFTDKCPYTDADIDFNFINTIAQIQDKDPSLGIQLLSSKPINSGVISLIYEGVLPNGKKVIVKVKRKNIKAKLIKALDEIEFAIEPISLFPHIKSLNLKNLFEENKKMMLVQADFKQEIDNINTMNETNKFIPYVKIPKVYDIFTAENEDMIVMEYINGNKLIDVKEEDKEQYSYLLTKFSIKSILYNGYYHADLHQGNILFIKNDILSVGEGGEEEDETESDEINHRLGIIDFGIMWRITREEQNKFYNFFQKLLEGNHYETAKVMLDFLIEPREDVEKLSINDYNMLIKVLEEFVNNVYENEKGFLSPDDIYKINIALYRYNLKLSRTFCKIEVSLAISDSVCSNLSVATPFIEIVTKVSNEIFPSSLMDY